MVDVNSRDIALLGWLAVFVILTFAIGKVRPSAFGVLSALFQSTIIDILGLAAIYTGGCVWVLAQVGAWELRNLKTVVFWFFGTAIVTMFNVPKMKGDTSAFRAMVKEAVTVSAVIGFVGGINTLPLWAEALLLPMLAFLTMLLTVAQHDPKSRILVGPLSSVLSAAGYGILGYSLYRVYTHWQQFDTIHQAREFGIPIALTVMFLPFLYVLMTYMEMQSTGTRLRMLTDDRALRRFIWVRGILTFGFNHRTFARLVRGFHLSDHRDRAGVLQVIAELKRARRREKNPPWVDWAEGWSPYEARDFLAAYQLRTEEYHRANKLWIAASESLRLGGDIWHDRLTYRIAGTETAATQLSLTLNAETPGESKDGDEHFWLVAEVLVLVVFGDETVERFSAMMVGKNSASMEVGEAKLQLMRDDWGNEKRGGYYRKLTITHPAYHDPYLVF